MANENVTLKIHKDIQQLLETLSTLYTLGNSAKPLDAVSDISHLVCGPHVTNISDTSKDAQRKAKSGHAFKILIKLVAHSTGPS